MLELIKQMESEQLNGVDLRNSKEVEKKNTFKGSFLCTLNEMTGFGSVLLGYLGKVICTKYLR